ncbi:MAG: hypothetical protein M3Y87_06390 [Myxococcota bacterium]|nr:hypothetical protein [Myxococcota bacterium]
MFDAAPPLVLDGGEASVTPGANRQTVDTGPPPSGPLTHYADLVELSDAESPATYTLFPSGGGVGCVVETAQRMLLVRWVSDAGRDADANEAARLAVETGTVGFVAEGCGVRTIAFALPGAHPGARLLAADDSDGETVLVDAAGVAYGFAEHGTVLARLATRTE